jgi:hypothetical protein
MAVLNAVVPPRALVVPTFLAAESAGDQFAPGGGGLMLFFRNTHTAAVTVNIAPTISTVRTSGGDVTTPTRTIAVPANGGMVSFYMPMSVLAPYLDANGRLPLTYASWNIGLTVRAYAMPYSS